MALAAVRRSKESFYGELLALCQGDRCDHWFTIHIENYLSPLKRYLRPHSAGCMERRQHIEHSAVRCHVNLQTFGRMLSDGEERRYDLCWLCADNNDDGYQTFRTITFS